MADLTALDDLLADVPEQLKRGSRKREPSAKRIDTKSLLESFPVGPPCRAVVRRREDLLMQLRTSDKRHPVIVAPLLLLVRQAQVGHAGVKEALGDIGDAFVAAVKERPDAREEFERSRDGSLYEVFGKKEGNRYALCGCLMPSYWKVADQLRITGDVKDATHQRVYRALVEDAVLSRTRLIDESERQLSVTTDLALGTINVVLDRLVDAGALYVADDALLRKKAKYVLPCLAVLEAMRYAPDRSMAPVLGTSALDSSAPCLSEGTEDVSVFATAVHQLFGTEGLPVGAEKTFAYLPEWKQRVGHGALVRVTKGTLESGLIPELPRGRRRIPLPSPGQARSVAELAALTFQPPRTVDGQLKQMEFKGLAFKVGTRWWRCRFDADWLAARLGIPDTPAKKEEQYRRDRERLFTPVDRDGVKADRRTGEVVPNPDTTP